MKLRDRLFNKLIDLIWSTVWSALVGGFFALVAILGSLVILEIMKFLVEFFWLIFAYVELLPRPYNSIESKLLYDESAHRIVVLGVKAFGSLGLLSGLLMGWFTAPREK